MGNESRKRTRRTAAEKDEILAAYDAGRLTGREVATEHGIAVSTLYRWRRQGTTGRRTGRGQLIEIPNLMPARPAVATYRVLFGRGVVLEVAPGFAREEVRCLAQLIQSL